MEDLPQMCMMVGPWIWLIIRWCTGRETSALWTVMARRGEIPVTPEPATGVELLLRDVPLPSRAVEAVSGRALEFTAVDDRVRVR